MPFAVKNLDGSCKLTISSESDDEDSLVSLDSDEARSRGEESIQLKEGCRYEYEFSNPGWSLDENNTSKIVKTSGLQNNRGVITPGNYVGRLELVPIDANNEPCKAFGVEIRSTKAKYRSEYRSMLEDITDECMELLMQHTSPVTSTFSVDHEVLSKTLYQKFTFVKSIIDSDEFRNAVYRIISMPVTTWKEVVEDKDIRRAGRINSNHIRQIASGNNRIELPDSHPSSLRSVPARLAMLTKVDTVDTVENRFVKYVLSEFERFCGSLSRHIEDKGNTSHHIYTEVRILENKFSEYLSHNVFREVSNLYSLPLNNPVLQRKEGYREILRVWLMYDLAAKLSWDAQDQESYEVGKRDVATMYEYWLFFKLLRLVEHVFDVSPEEVSDKLISDTEDGLGLKLREGKHVAIHGRYNHKGRDLEIRYSYNRTFNKSDYPKSGSWTRQMRPDYTLSIWPSEFSDEEAEKQELMVHVHFDAKYRVDGLEYLNQSETESDNDLHVEKQQEKQGKYKRADLLKMHAYKDAIRRTVGAYVLYPGSNSNTFESFHEVVPGLGAFPISPSNDGRGLDAVQSFILEVVDHVSNRASQREQLTYRAYNVHKNKPDENYKVNESIPEFNSKGTRSTPPSEATVLVGFYKDKKQYKWIEGKGLYNIRLDAKGLKTFGVKEAGAKYLLLRSSGQFEIGDIWRIVGTDPEIMSKQDLLGEGYPSEPSCANYLVYKIEKAKEGDFNNAIWSIKKLSGYASDRANAARPFAVTLTELFQASISK
ncbi:DUF2357 domain-containing protein [Candidatus Thioglobus sp.]|nr:DUF2357 domain-containing protein [Candidatus Thioglobus sp.]